MKTLTNSQLIKEFNKFLRENNCASKFYVNKIKHYKKEKISTFLKKVSPENWIICAFPWRMQIEHGHSWNRLHVEWKNKLKEIGHKS